MKMDGGPPHLISESIKCSCSFSNSLPQVFEQSLILFSEKLRVCTLLCLCDIFVSRDDRAQVVSVRTEGERVDIGVAAELKGREKIL